MVEREYRGENQKVLARLQAEYSRTDDTASEESAVWSGRVVISVLQTQDRVARFVRDAIFESGREGLHGLSRQRPAAIAIPEHFGPNGCAPAFIHCPVNRQLTGHHQGAWIAGRHDFF